MKFYYVIKDGHIEGRCATKEDAIDMIRIKQDREKKTHQWLQAEFSIIEGTIQEFIKYE